MLDHLGLGIVLTMKDDFTPQANKAIQSMDRFTSKAEQMEKDVQKSMSNLQNIMLAGFSLNQVGGEFERAGKKILGGIKGIFSEVANIGASFQTQQRQLITAFKGNSDEAKKAFDWVREYASNTPFDVKGLATSFMKLKTSGIDMRESFRLATGETKLLAEAIGDLATRNMEAGGGVSGLGYALQEAWAGQYRSLVNRFNIAKADMAGMIKYAGKDVNKFTEEFIKLSQKYAPDALKNVQGTWAQVIANMKDTWENFVYDIGEAGIFQPMLNTLTKVQLTLASVTSNTQLVSNLANVLKDLWKPVDFVITKIAQAIAKLAEFAGEHPVLTKFITTIVAFTGVSLVLSGVIMKTVGSFLILSTSIVSAYANLRIMNTLPTVANLSGLGLKVGAIAKGFGILGLIVGVVALGFTKNIGGMRDKWNVLVRDWKDSNEILKAGASNIQKFEQAMDKSISNMTIKMMKFRMFFKVMFNTLFGKEISGAIQYTEKDIENLRVLGMLPFAQTMAMLKGRVREFTGGFIDGLKTAYTVAKNFLDFALVPVKAILESLSNFAPIKAIASLFGVKKDGGIDEGVAKGQLEQFRKLGEVAGKVIGIILGFKIVKSVTSFIVSPFKSLFEYLGKSKKATEELKDSVKSLGTLGALKRGIAGVGGFVGGVGGFVGGFGGRARRAKDHFNDFLAERSELPKTSKGSVRGYNTASYSDVPKNFRDYNIASGGNPNELHVKKSPKLLQSLFGAKYYNQQEDGSMKYVGRYGGRFMQSRDDKQTRLASQKLGIKPPTLSDLDSVYGGDKEAWQRDIKMFIPQDKKIGSQANLKGSGYATALESLTATRDSRVDNIISDPKFRAKAYKEAGISGRSFNRKEADRKAFLTKKAYEADPTLFGIDKGIDNIGKQADTNAPVYQAKRSKLGQVLFGQRLYTPAQREDGTFYEKTVAHRGGLFRSSKNDMTYNDEGDVSLGGKFTRAKHKFASSNLGMSIFDAKEGLKEKASMLQDKAGGLMSGIAESKVGKGLGSFFGRIGGGAKKAVGAPLNFVNKQRARLGWSPLGKGKDDEDDDGTPKKGLLGRVGGMFGKAKSGAGKVFRGLFGKGEEDEDGKVKGGGFFRRVGRGVGAVGRGIGAVGRGAGKVLGGAGRLAGGIGRGVMGALPMLGGAVSIGKMGFDFIKGQGGGDFSKGVDVLREKLANMDFQGMFKKLVDGFKTNLQKFLPLVKDVFKAIAKELPGLLKQAWDGISAMGKIAWEFISTHGKDIFNGLVSTLAPILGKIWDGLKAGAKFAWDWIVQNGGSMLKGFVEFITPVLGKIWEGLKSMASKFWNWVLTDGLSMVVNLIGIVVEWLIGTGLPLLIKAIMGLGKWLVTEAIPKLLVIIWKLAITLGESILKGVSKALGALGKVLGNAVLSTLRLVIKSLLPSPIDDTVIKALGLAKVGVHHQGLWMSDDEHQAIIRKDETVLPPDKSRQLDDFLSNPNKPKNGAPSSVDNSIRIDKVEIIVKADKLSQQEAREQAKMILDEFKKLQKEKNIRQYA